MKPLGGSRKGSHRSKTAPAEVQEHGAGGEAWFGGSIPEWDESQLPDPVTMYSFACRQMALLATSCPAFEVRKAAAEFLAKEFAPAKPASGMSERQQLVIELRREIARFESAQPAEELELESETQGVIEGQTRR